jgi:hypothetical protein
MMHGRLHVSPECVLIRAEADDYAAQEPTEGKDDSHLVPIKTNDHRLDAARYGWMQRFWDPLLEQAEQAPNLSRYRPTGSPMGSGRIRHRTFLVTGRTAGSTFQPRWGT